METKKRTNQMSLVIADSPIDEFMEFIKQVEDNNKVLVLSFYQLTNEKHVVKNEHRDIEIKFTWANNVMKHPLLRVEVNNYEFELFIRNKYKITESFPVVVIIKGNTIIDRFYGYGRVENLIRQINSIPADTRSNALRDGIGTNNSKAAMGLIGYAFLSGLTSRNAINNSMLTKWGVKCQ